MTKHHERAFPLHPGTLPEWQDNAGMTKREHFAGLAMQGIMSGHFAHYGHEDFWAPDELAFTAVAYADALIAELSKGGDA